MSVDIRWRRASLAREAGRVSGCESIDGAVPGRVCAGTEEDAMLDPLLGLRKLLPSPYFEFVYRRDSSSSAAR
jgi:hypothetical protein